MPKRICVTLLFTMVFAIVTLSAASFVAADEPPPGVPVTPPGPFQCETNNFTVTAKLGTGGEFPVMVSCPDADPAKQCEEYSYSVVSPTGKKIDHTLIMVSADQYLWSSNPSSYIPDRLGVPDSATKLGAYMVHEYPVRFNGNASTYDFSLFIEGRSSPDLTTVYVSSGNKIQEACLIAGPGDPLNPFEYQTFSKSGTGAGGKCNVKMTYVNNKLVKVELDPPEQEGCYDGELRKINGEPVQHLQATLTFGNNTTTCYPLSPPWCVCTAWPCPGNTE